MGIFGRLLGMVKSKVKESRTAGLVATSTFGRAIWSDRRYDIFAQEAYMKNVIAFRAVSEVSMAVASVPWNLFRYVSKGQREAVESNTIANILRRANIRESWMMIMMKLTAFYLLDGNVFLERIGPTTGPNRGVPKEIYVHRPDRIQLLATTGGDGKVRHTGYRYSVGDNKVDWEIDPDNGQCDMLHIKSFHPLDDWWGAAPTEATAREIDTSNEATEWNKKLLQNEGRPGMVVTVVGEMTDVQFEALEKKLREGHTGADAAGKNLLLVGEKGTTALPYGWSPADMDYIEGHREWARRIALGYGVPPMLLGIPGDNTYSNYKEARLAFWENTVLFHLSMFREEINTWIFGSEKEKLFIDYDLDQVPALELKREELWKRAQTSEFLTVNEKREMVGLPLIEGGNVVLISATVVPFIGEDAEGVGNETEEEEETEKTVQKLMTLHNMSRGDAEKFLGIQ